MAVAITLREWTLEDLDRLPEDGNRYEVVYGELFVTPAPSTAHERIVARLNAVLVPYVEREQLGRVYHPRSIVRHRGSQAEPDLMVRSELTRGTRKDADWNVAPVPMLIVEVVSAYTRLRDRGAKKRLYREAGVAEYWIVDAEDESVTVARVNGEELEDREVLRWEPAGASAPLEIDLGWLFGP